MKKIYLSKWSETMATPQGGEQHLRTPFGKGVSWDTFQVSLLDGIHLQVQRIDDPNLLIFRNPKIAPELEGYELIPLKNDFEAIALAKRYGIVCLENGLVI